MIPCKDKRDAAEIRPLDEGVVDGGERQLNGAQSVSQQPLTTKELALLYSQTGWAVFPVHGVRVENGTRTCTCPKGSACPNMGKHPRTPKGVKDATSDPKIISDWFERFSDSNVAVATGAFSNILVLDIDPRHGGGRWRI